MPDPGLFLKATVAATGASAVFVLALGCVRRPEFTSRMNLACVLGVALGLMLGLFLLDLRPDWPPAKGLDRFLTVILPAALAIELVIASYWPPCWLIWTLRLGLTAVVGRIILHDSIYLVGPRSWTAWQMVLALAACGCLLATVWGLLVCLSRSAKDVSILFAISQATICASFIAMMAGYVTGGAAALPLAAALAGTAMASWIIVPRHAIEGTIGIGLVGLFGLLLIYRFFGGMTTTQALVIFCSPLLCWFTEFPKGRRRAPWLVGLVRLALVAIPLIAVLFLAKRKFDRDMGPLLGNAAISPHEFRASEPTGLIHTLAV